MSRPNVTELAKNTGSSPTPAPVGGPPVITTGEVLVPSEPVPLTSMNPALIVVVPVYVFAPVRVRVPVPDLVSPPVPVIGADTLSWLLSPVVKTFASADPNA